MQKNNSKNSYKKHTVSAYKYIPYIFGSIVIILLVLNLIYISRSSANTVTANTISKTQLMNPIQTQVINKSLSFPLLDSNGIVVSKISYKVVSAELRDQIIVKGQPVMPIAGKTFLVINLELTNSYDKSVQINTRDYIRIVKNNSSEHLAADINNDPVEVQAISTVQTRLALAIDTTDKSLVMEVGEISGPKTKIPLKLKYGTSEK